MSEDEEIYMHVMQPLTQEDVAKAVESIQDSSVYMTVSDSDEEAEESAYVEDMIAKAKKAGSKATGDVKHADPIDGWLAAVQSTEESEPIELTTLHPELKHQTLVIIEASSKSRHEFKERMLRFISGLNTEITMKANVITVTDGKMYAGLTFHGKESGGYQVPIVKGRWNAVIRISDKDT